MHTQIFDGFHLKLLEIFTFFICRDILFWVWGLFYQKPKEPIMVIICHYNIKNNGTSFVIFKVISKTESLTQKSMQYTTSSDYLYYNNLTKGKNGSRNHYEIINPKNNIPILKKVRYKMPRRDLTSALICYLAFLLWDCY